MPRDPLTMCCPDAYIWATAGASRIARLRKQAQEQGLNLDKWFGNVEFMVAKDIGQETVEYTLAMQGLEDRGQPEACHIRGVRP